MAKTPAQRAAKHGDQATPSATPPPVKAALASEQPEGNVNLILIAGAAATLFLFWYFHLLVLNQMTDLSGGLAMPDSRIFGFNVSDVQTLRAAMNADANGQLQFVHKTAGVLFPLAFALTSIVFIGVKVAKKTVRRVLWVVPTLFAVTQIAANICIDNMLGAAHLSPTLVGWTSVLVVASWLFLFASLLAVIAALFIHRATSRGMARASTLPNQPES